tara:strand:- start:1033 stop:1776 length:744 start_codon:yes stop_codon:yes gene_type:complete
MSNNNHSNILEKKNKFISLSGKIHTYSLQKRVKCFFLYWVIYFFIRSLHATLRYQIVNKAFKDKAENLHPRKSFALAIWHQNLLLGITANKNQDLCLLVSPSFDGEIVAQVAKKFSLNSIRGSSSGHGDSALLRLFRYTRKGGKVAFAVDGPKGPIHKVKDGIILLSRNNQIPILPFATISNNYWTFSKTWDKFRFPKPFSTVKVIYGEPFITSKTQNKEEDIRKSRSHLEKSLMNLEKSLHMKNLS